MPEPSASGYARASRRLRRAAWATGLALLLAAAPGAADAAPTSPALGLEVEPLVQDGHTSLRVTVKNLTEGPIDVLADGRFLNLEVIRGKDRVTCAVPRDGVRGARQALAAGASLALLAPAEELCFGAREYALLLQGGTVTARYGARDGNPAGILPPTSPKGRATAIAEVSSKATPLAPSASVLPELPSTLPFALSTTSRIDTLSGRGLSMAFTVTNIGGSSRTAWLRPAGIAVSVTNPKGITTRCSAQRPLINPPREMFTTLGPKGQTVVYVSLDELCPDETFAEPGLYRLEGSLDTRPAAGRIRGLETLDVLLVGTGPTLLRRRRTDAPLFVQR